VSVEPADPDAVDRPRRDPIDLDRLIEVVFTLFAFIMYAVGSVVGALLLGGWMGAFALAGFSVPPMAYVLVKSAQRRGERARERSQADAPGYTPPVIPVRR
jgi:hypothetical protein